MLQLVNKLFFLFALVFAQNAFSGASNVSTIRGKVITFDEKKVKLQVGKKSVYVARSSIKVPNLKVGQDVESVSKNNFQKKK